jgi:hypothetical protein
MNITTEEALQVSCPWCSVAAGQSCAKIGKGGVPVGEIAKPHKQRVIKAYWAAEKH